MNLKQFYTCGTHLDNLADDQFKELFDLEAIAELPNTEFEQNRVRLLSQYLTGNVSETFEEISEMDKAEQCRTLDTWLTLVKDPQELREIGKTICQQLIRGKAV